MVEEAINKVLRRIKNGTAEILDDESFNVAEARGKQAKIVDFTCYDKGVFKLVKVCLDCITQKELDDLLRYNDCQVTANTIMQIDFWRKNGKKPFWREKLFYNQPEQRIAQKLKNLVK